MKITVYTITDCKFSQAEKQYLQEKNMQFEEKNLEANREYLTEMLTISNNFAGTPVTKIEKDDGQVIVLKGFTKDEFDKALGGVASAVAPPDMKIEPKTETTSDTKPVEPMTPPTAVTPPNPPFMSDTQMPPQQTAPSTVTPPTPAQPVAPPVQTVAPVNPEPVVEPVAPPPVMPPQESIVPPIAPAAPVQPAMPAQPMISAEDNHNEEALTSVLQDLQSKVGPDDQPTQ